MQIQIFRTWPQRLNRSGAVIDDATIEKRRNSLSSGMRATTVWAVGLKSAVVEILPALTDAVETAISFLKTDLFDIFGHQEHQRRRVFRLMPSWPLPARLARSDFSLGRVNHNQVAALG